MRAHISGAFAPSGFDVTSAISTISGSDPERDQTEHPWLLVFDEPRDDEQREHREHAVEGLVADQHRRDQAAWTLEELDDALIDERLAANELLAIDASKREQCDLG